MIRISIIAFSEFPIIKGRVNMSIQEKLKIINRNRSWPFTMPLWLTLLVPGALLWISFPFLSNNADTWKKCLGAFIAGVALVILIYLLMRISYRMFQERWVRIAGFLLLFVLGLRLLLGLIFILLALPLLGV
jgi:CDP-diglyceride synthetase